ncbi:hypothetical protein [Sphingosinicella sp. LY1275]|uniref:hypothetical protein n=1 Tax=Sphingosinicella sp. LY1275 TaxID=3095379 RepID=UPI002ADEFB2A|nr:hypothetical protein [Sphingosinicella sp. LY1275]MEA1013710.1 hypothetical protein [Sphingosinicella sp. LY1275]
MLQYSCTMQRKVLTRSFWEPISRSLFLITTGAYLLAWYLTAQEQLPNAAGPIFDGLKFLWPILLVACTATMPRQRQTVEDPGPAFSGTAVVLASGLGAAIFLAEDASAPNDFIGPAMVGIATLVLALAAYRFASKHAGDIGEARFNSTDGSGE